MNLSHFLIAIFFLLNISYALRSSTSYSEDDYDPPEYRNYSARDGGYSYAPRGPSEYSTVFLQNATFATYDGDPFAWQFDHTQKSRRSYDQEVQNWVYANVQVAWSWAWAKWTAENGWLSDYGYTCGYASNPYNTIETRHAKRAEVITYWTEWFWDNFPSYLGDRKKLFNAMYHLNTYELQIPFIQDCLAETYDQWRGTCDQYQLYSRPDQMCNNLVYPTWGAYLDIGIRITNIWNYEDGVSQPMFHNPAPTYGGAITPLIDAKVLANALDNSNYGQCYNLDVTAIGSLFDQFIAHDIIKSAAHTVSTLNGRQVKPDCCSGTGNCLHHACASFYGHAPDGYGYCEPYARNLPAIDYCNPIPKDPTNLVTSYIDASPIYGSTCYEASRVRSYRRGKLRVNKGRYGIYERNILLPDDPNPDPDECNVNYLDKDLKCLLAGDSRNSQHGGLVAFHTVFLRVHNRVAASCAKYLDRFYLNEDVVDEICFQETRKLIISVLQRIMFRDSLTITLGPYITTNPNYGLSLDYVLPYNPDAHASTWPEYAYAAGRRHTAVSHWTQTVDLKRAELGLQPPDVWYGIYDWYQRAYALTYDKVRFNEILSNSLYDPEQCFDTNFVPALRHPNPNYGPPLDMFWTNIQRNREFGNPMYWEFREWCGMDPLRDWHQLSNVWSKQCLEILPGLLYDVKNVEGYIGMLCEKPLQGAAVGPTTACVLQRQYYNLREGDRFFHDRIGYTADQIAVIDKFNMGKLLCIATTITHVTENVLRTPSDYTNKYQLCNVYDDITEDDLSVMWSTIPTVPGDYRTCRDYGGFTNQEYFNLTLAIKD